MKRPVDAVGASCSCISTESSGATGRCQPPGRPVAEAIEEAPFPFLQLGTHSFDSSKAQQGSVEMQELCIGDHTELRANLQTSPAYTVTSGHPGPAVNRSAVALNKNSASAAASAGCRTGVSIGACAASAVNHSCNTQTAELTAYSSSSSHICPTDRGVMAGIKGKVQSNCQTHHCTESSLASAASGPFYLAAASPLPLLKAPAVLPPTTAAAAATATAEPLPATAITHATLWPYIQMYGRGIMSISTLQEGLQHYMLPGVGYMAYSMMTNGLEMMNILTPVVLGDPLCHPSNYRLIASAFLKRYPGAMFLQVSKSFAFVLRGLGLLINSVGGETQLDLTVYTFSGYAKRGLRSAISSAVKEGVAVEEVMRTHLSPASSMGAVLAASEAAAVTADWSGVASEMAEVDKRWLDNKGSRAGRVWFVNRKPVFSPEPGVRKFVARDRIGRMLAFVFFDAVYEDGVITGYYANVTRMRPDAHPGVLNLIIKEFIDRVRSESNFIAPTKSVSLKKSQRKKQEAAAAESAQHSHTAATSAKPAARAQHLRSTHSSSSSSSSPGPVILSLGLSPLHQMIDGDPFSYSRFIRRLFQFSFQQGSGYYPFDTLAAAKAKYGAGLHDGVYDDPHAKYKQVYLAHTCRNYACMTMFDLGRMLGFWKSPSDAAMAFSGHKIKDGLKLLKHTVKRLQTSKSSCGKGAAALPSTSSCGSSGSKSGRYAASSSSSISSSRAAAAAAGPAVHPTAGSDSAESYDSRDENWKVGCFIFNRGRRQQCDPQAVKESAATAAAPAADGLSKNTAAQQSSSSSSSTCCSKSSRCRLCMLKMGRVLLPLPLPLDSQTAPAGAAAAVAQKGSAGKAVCQAADSSKAAKAAAAGAMAVAQTKAFPNHSSLAGAESSGSELIGAGSRAGWGSSELSSSVTSDGAESSGASATAAE